MRALISHPRMIGKQTPSHGQPEPDVYVRSEKRSELRENPGGRIDRLTLTGFGRSDTLPAWG